MRETVGGRAVPAGEVIGAIDGDAEADLEGETCALTDNSHSNTGWCLQQQGQGADLGRVSAEVQHGVVREQPRAPARALHQRAQRAQGGLLVRRTPHLVPLRAGQEGNEHVLGGDVLALPREAPLERRALVADRLAARRVVEAGLVPWLRRHQPQYARAQSRELIHRVWLGLLPVRPPPPRPRLQRRLAVDVSELGGDAREADRA